MVGTIAVASFMLTLQQRQDIVGPIAPTTATTIEGRTVAVPDPKAKATVLVFLLTDCPIANRYAPELHRLQEQYKESGISFVRVYVYPDATKETISDHTKQYDYKWPAVHDKQRKLVKAVGATVTPEVAVLLPDGTMAYRGRIDDRYIEHGRLRELDYRLDLRIALDEILAEKQVSIPRTVALGCFIEG